MRRLEIVNELYQFGQFLRSAKYQGKVSDLENAAREGDVTGGSNSIRSGLEPQATRRLDPPVA